MVLLIIIPFLNGYFIGNIPNIFRQTHISIAWTVGLCLWLNLTLVYGRYNELDNYTGWWLSHPSEKYYSVGVTIPNIWKNKKMLQTTPRYQYSNLETDQKEK